MISNGTSRLIKFLFIAVAIAVVENGTGCASSRGSISDRYDCFERAVTDGAEREGGRLCLHGRGRASLDVWVETDANRSDGRSTVRHCFAGGQFVESSSESKLSALIDTASCTDAYLIHAHRMQCEMHGQDELRCLVPEMNTNFFWKRAAPSQRYSGQRAVSSFVAERYPATLRQLVSSLRDAAGDPDPRELAVYLATLRALERNVEADGLARFFSAFWGGSISDTTQPPIDLRNCLHLTTDKPPESRLIRSWGVKPDERLDRNLGRVATEIVIDETAEIKGLQIHAARDPIAAVLIARMMMKSRISRAKVRQFEPSDFPLSVCAFWNSDSIPWHRTRPGMWRGTARPL